MKARRFEEKDAGVVSELVIETLKTICKNDYTEDEIRKICERMRTEDILERAKWTHFYVIEDDESTRLLGCGAIGPYWDSKTESSLFTIFAASDCQGKGVGRKIIETLEQDPYFLNAERVEIPASITAVEFYKKMGYGYKNCVDAPDEEGMYRLEKIRHPKLRIEKIMELAEFPEDTKQEILRVCDLFEKEEKMEELHKSAIMLTELPTEINALGRELEKLTLLWSEEFGVHKYTIELLILLECWAIVKHKYEKHNISMEIYKRSLHDLYCKIMECRNVYGVHGIFVGFWYDRFFELSRFALGRLQFELIPYPFETVVNVQGRKLKKGDWVINMHIPSEGPLNTEAVEDALARAREFFTEYAGVMPIPDKFEKKDGFHFPGQIEQPFIFVMDSWLLDPDLQSLLPEGNIRTFTSRFEVVHTKKENTFMDGWRVFAKDWEKIPEELPQKTRLQKNIAEYLKNGGKLGEGFGVLVE